MNFFFRNRSIKVKLVAIAMATSALSLALSGAAFYYGSHNAQRNAMIRNLRILAEVVGNNGAAALAFGDEPAASEILESASADEHIEAACIYDRSGAAFAFYLSPNADEGPCPDRAPADRISIVNPDRDVAVVGAISLDGERIGSVYVRSDTNLIESRLKGQMAWGVVFSTVSLIAAGLLILRLQGVVSTPILNLARLMKAVSRDKNYALRSEKLCDDEVGALIDGFNEMLTQIQGRDEKLRESHARLEEEVKARTFELEWANRTLELDVSRRKEAEEALKASEARLRLVNEYLNVVLDSATKFAIVATDASGAVRIFNAGAEHIFGLPADEAVGQKAPSALGLPPGAFGRADSDFEDMAEAVLKEGGEGRDLTCVRPDGSARTVEFSIARIEGEGGDDDRGLLFLARDVTDRRETERKLKTVQDELLEAAHAAGMAEIASDVLHNVGNLLNIVNVTAESIVAEVKNSKLHGLIEANDLLARQGANLAEFLSSDPRGARLPELYRLLGAALESERGRIEENARRLHDSVRLIRDVIATQQEYARVNAYFEEIDLPRLVDDAIEFQEKSLLRHGVKVTRRFESVPPVQAQKTKLLNVLVNLIKNAKEAMDSGPDGPKILTLWIARDGDGNPTLTVEDTGTGIGPGDLEKIFTYGFTTKNKGHGFGLHNCANAMIEMEGDISVRSEGIGKGAAFTLTFQAAESDPGASHEAA